MIRNGRTTPASVPPLIFRQGRGDGDIAKSAGKSLDAADMTVRATSLKRRGSDSTMGTPLFASTASPNKAEATGRKRESRSRTQGSASSMAAEKVAVRGRSVTPVWLNPNQPPQVARMSVAKEAARQPNSRLRIHQ